MQLPRRFIAAQCQGFIVPGKRLRNFSAVFTDAQKHGDLPCCVIAVATACNSSVQFCTRPPLIGCKIITGPNGCDFLCGCSEARFHYEGREITYRELMRREDGLTDQTILGMNKWRDEYADEDEGEELRHDPVEPGEPDNGGNRKLDFKTPEFAAFRKNYHMRLRGGEIPDLEELPEMHNVVAKAEFKLSLARKRLEEFLTLEQAAEVVDLLEEHPLELP